jgi:hypothetical protein
MTPEDEAFYAAGGAVPLVTFQRRAPGRAYMDVDNLKGDAAPARARPAAGRCPLVCFLPVVRPA